MFDNDFARMFLAGQLADAEVRADIAQQVHDFLTRNDVTHVSFTYSDGNTSAGTPKEAAEYLIELACQALGVDTSA